MTMDWKQALMQKVASGDIPQDNTPDTPENEPLAQADELRVVIDRKGRKGKTATIIEGFTCSDGEVAKIASMLKSKLGTGGSSRGGEILIQGDYASKAAQLLKDIGYKAKCF